MIWSSFTLAVGLASLAGAAAVLLLRSSRLAIPAHGCCLALAFGCTGAAIGVLDRDLGAEWFFPDTAGLCALVLAIVITPFCVGAAIFTTLINKQRRLAFAAALVCLALFLIVIVRELAILILLTAGISAVLVAPSVFVHRMIRQMPATDSGDRKLAAVVWTLMNAFLVYCCATRAEPRLPD